MPRLTEEKREFCERNVEWFVDWILSRYLNSNLVLLSIFRLGSLEDVKQVLSVFFCQCIGRVKYLNGNQVPSFVAKTLSAQLSQLVNMKRHENPANTIRLSEFYASSMLDYGDDAESVFSSGEELDRVNSAINALPEPARTACRLYFIDGKSPLCSVGRSRCKNNEEAVKQLRKWAVMAYNCAF